MDQHIAELLGLDVTDPETVALSRATAEDSDLIERLVQVRRDRGLTQQDVAERMGRSQPNVSAFERVGGDPHLSTIRRYAVAVGAQVRWQVVLDGESTTVHFSPRSVTGNVQDFYQQAR